MSVLTKVYSVNFTYSYRSHQTLLWWIPKTHTCLSLYAVFIHILWCYRRMLDVGFCNLLVCEHFRRLILDKGGVRGWGSWPHVRTAIVISVSLKVAPLVLSYEEFDTPQTDYLYPGMSVSRVVGSNTGSLSSISVLTSQAQMFSVLSPAALSNRLRLVLEQATTSTTKRWGYASGMTVCLCVWWVGGREGHLSWPIKSITGGPLYTHAHTPVPTRTDVHAQTDSQTFDPSHGVRKHM